MAGSKTPSYCVMGDTAAVARVMEKMGEGMRIHISSTTKELLDKLEGYRWNIVHNRWANKNYYCNNNILFRCEARGVLDLGVSLYIYILNLVSFCILFVLD